jgi:hypothetical protein
MRSSAEGRAPLRFQSSNNRPPIAFADDGSIPFEKTDEGECRVRMQRIGPWLMVQDNGECGGAAVTFSALYHRIK